MTLRNIYLSSLGALALTGVADAGGIDAKVKELENQAPLNKEQVQSAKANHNKNSVMLSHKQDELSADVQELIERQTNKKVIQLLEEAEALMAEVTDKLEERDTKPPTIAAETEIIEKILDAAKQKSKSQENKSSKSMGQTLQELLDQLPQNQPGQQPGEGQQGDTNMSNDDINGEANRMSDERRIPKKAGPAGARIPSEFRHAVEAYRKAQENMPPAR